MADDGDDKLPDPSVTGGLSKCVLGPSLVGRRIKFASLTSFSRRKRDSFTADGKFPSVSLLTRPQLTPIRYSSGAAAAILFRS